MSSSGASLKTAKALVFHTALSKQAELAELVDALDSGSSVRKDFRVQVPGSAYFKH